MYEKLFEPIKLNSVTIPNRIANSAHSTRLMGEDLIAYYEERARGGVGLVVLGAMGVHQTSPTPALTIGIDGMLSLHAALTKRLEKYGTRVFQQLWHGGAASFADRPGSEVWSASSVPHPRTGVVPKPMTQEMIHELVEAFGITARRALEAGLSGVEVHAAHSYLFGQFLSPALNHREDEYGGTEENRTRFLREVLAVMRKETNPSFPIGVRLSADDSISGGLRPLDTASIAKRIEDLADFIDLSYGGHWHHHRMYRSMEAPLGYQLSAAEVVTRAVTIPTMVTGRIMSLDQAEHVVVSGIADVVSMVRALIADPGMIVKARSGRSEEVRPCVGSNVGCIGGAKAGHIGCVVNPAAGREGSMPFDPDDRVDRPKNVLIVGGGPAGMEAARAAALRGHRVVIHDIHQELGGQCRFAASVSERADFAAIIRWQESELIRLGVTIRRGSFVDPDVVIASSPHEVIVATGSRPERTSRSVLSPAEPLPGASLPHVFTSWDALGFGGRASLGRRTVVFDDTGSLEAITVALKVAREGVETTVVSRREMLGARVPAPLATVEPLIERLMNHSVRLITSTTLSKVTPDSVLLLAAGTDKQLTMETDSVILVHHRIPNREIADELARINVPYHVIGDANGTDDLLHAIHDGSRIGRSI